jgi:hypothetical protein
MRRPPSDDPRVPCKDAKKWTVAVATILDYLGWLVLPAQIEEMPTIEQLIAGYQELINPAETAGITAHQPTRDDCRPSTRRPTTHTPTSTGPNASHRR